VANSLLSSCDVHNRPSLVPAHAESAPSSFASASPSVGHPQRLHIYGCRSHSRLLTFLQSKHRILLISMIQYADVSKEICLREDTYPRSMARARASHAPSICDARHISQLLLSFPPAFLCAFTIVFLFTFFRLRSQKESVPRDVERPPTLRSVKIPRGQILTLVVHNFSWAP
jgi:hypothetical protein